MLRRYSKHNLLLTCRKAIVGEIEALEISCVNKTPQKPRAKQSVTSIKEDIAIVMTSGIKIQN